MRPVIASTVAGLTLVLLAACSGSDSTAESAETAAPDTPELRAAAATYEAYVADQGELLIDRTTEFVNAVKAGDVERAKVLYPQARTPWERIEPVAETFGDLDPITDGREPDAKADGSDFTGWHRIEKQLWVAGDTKGMDTYADDLLANVTKIVDQADDNALDALQLATGSKGLLDEVATSKVTGEEDIYSHTDLWDFKANVEGAQAAIDALRPVIEDVEPDLMSTLDDRFAALDDELAQYRDGDGWQSYDTLTKDQVTSLSRAVAAVSEPISQVGAAVTSSAAGSGQ